MRTSAKVSGMRTSLFHIRRASPNDISLLTGVIRTSFIDVATRFGITKENAPSHPSNCTEEWIKKDLGRGVIYYILEHEGEAVGCAAFEQASDELCYLERLAVLPVHRRKGYGGALVNNIILKARTLGVREVGIGIIAHHTELKQWYARLGFIEQEVRNYAHLPFQVCFLNYPL